MNAIYNLTWTPMLMMMLLLSDFYCLFIRGIHAGTNMSTLCWPRPRLIFGMFSPVLKCRDEGQGEVLVFSVF